MYSTSLRQYVLEISERAHVDPREVSILDQSAACLVAAMGRAMGGRTYPPADYMKLSLQLLLLDAGLAMARPGTELDGAHYLVGLGLEQSGELLARLYAGHMSRARHPLENDHWYRLALALLHYLASGHRVQALSTLRHLDRIASSSEPGPYAARYVEAQRALGQLYAGESPSGGRSDWESLLSRTDRAAAAQVRRISRLVRRIRARQDLTLADLGKDTEAQWLSARGVPSAAAPFWTGYLDGLQSRGITTLTGAQVGRGGLDAWLRCGLNLLVVLPTGAGKTIIGELRSALALAEGKQVLWMLPTRALVRQAKRELRRAFGQVGISVEELPTTEDYIPLFSEGVARPGAVAATTPEKMAALLRANPRAARRVGLVVLDEAQILQSGARGSTAEFVLQRVRSVAPECDIILMTASPEAAEALDELLLGLGGDREVLASTARPTRQLCGVLTDQQTDRRPHPVVLLYPPGVHTESETTDAPLRIDMDEIMLGADPGALETAREFASRLARTPLRTVVFTARRDWAEVSARRIAERLPETVTLPSGDVARFRVELGRDSVIEERCAKRVAPHHAGLTPLEQHVVEKWVRRGFVKTVVATSTLAEGVNLPFDVSIVTFTRRFNARIGGAEDLPRSEVLNMLGRAGRAGQISDAVCLLAVPSARSPAVRVLDAQRRWYFGSREPSGALLGLARLLAAAVDAQVSDAEWLAELSGITFTEAQALVSFVLQATLDRHDAREALIDQFGAFPSTQGVSAAELERTAVNLERLVRNVREECEGDGPLLRALTRTGMPIDVLRHILSELRSDPDVLQMEPDGLVSWADEVVRSGLDSCSSRQWYDSLVRGADLNSMFAAISLWRNGAPIAQIESSWQLSTSQRAIERSNRLKIGRFLNQRLPLFSQFWGALAVCGEEIHGTDAAQLGTVPLIRLAAFVREGVSSLEQLEWLRALGGLDRVLAHALAAVLRAMSGPVPLRLQIRGRLERWTDSPHLVPGEVEEPFRSAVIGVLDDMRRSRPS